MWTIEVLWRREDKSGDDNEKDEDVDQSSPKTYWYSAIAVGRFSLELVIADPVFQNFYCWEYVQPTTND